MIGLIIAQYMLARKTACRAIAFSDGGQCLQTRKTKNFYATIYEKLSALASLCEICIDSCLIWLRLYYGIFSA
jgi:hypothetical protein